MHEITVNTVQGIGDLFWVYQKLVLHYDRIHFNVLCVGTDPLQVRGLPFLRMLPKVGNITYQIVPRDRYLEVAQTLYEFPVSSGRVVDYAVNAHLEAGTRLLDIDPGAPVAGFIDLKGQRAVEQGQYLCVFVAGAKAADTWDAGQWVRAIRHVADMVDTRQVVLVGAQWDVPVQNEVLSHLVLDCHVTSHVGELNLCDTLSVIRGSKFFLGYQSGLSVIAENYDVPQLMVYYPHLRPMLYTWCKPRSVGTQFRAMTFEDSIETVSQLYTHQPG
jgi:hypothetical protein